MTDINIAIKIYKSAKRERNQLKKHVFENIYYSSANISIFIINFEYNKFSLDFNCYIN